MDIDIPTGLDAWIEKDGIFGRTAGDTLVQLGERLMKNDIVQLGYCQEW